MPNSLAASAPDPLPHLRTLVRWLVELPALILLAWLVGYWWYSLSIHWQEDWANARLPEVERQFTFFTVDQEGEWLAIVLAAALYGAIGWRWLGGWLVLPQMLGILILGALSIGAAWDAQGHRFPTSVPFTLQAAVLSSVILWLGIGHWNRRTPLRPLTLRAMFTAVLVFAVILGGLQAWLRWRNAEERRAYEALMRELQGLL